MYNKFFSIKGILVILIVVFVIALSLLIYKQFNTPKTIKDVVLGSGGSIDNRVYIKEDNDYIPYVAIKTTNYNEGILLVRENVLSDPMIYRDENGYGQAGCYYCDSNIDVFLENEFWNRFSQPMKNIINYTPVVIHSKEYIANASEASNVYDIIRRHIFCLSATEYGYSPFSWKDYEGIAIPELKYITSQYEIWTRSHTMGDDIYVNTVIGLGINNSKITNEAYIRPAFTVPDSIEIIQYSIDGSTCEKIYVFDINE